MRISSGFVIAALYAVLGAIGLTLAIPPGYASPIFPAAGLALAVALFHGRGALIYIWLGSFALNIGQAIHSHELTLSTAVVAACIAVGATLQAALGQALVTWRLGRTWQHLEYEGQIVSFLLWGCVLACLSSATVAVTALWGLGMIGSESIPFSWWTWYTGDLLGAAIFAPLTLLHYAPDSALARERRRRIVIPIFIALGLSMLIYAGVSHMEHRQIQAQVEHDGEILAKRIQDRLITHQAVISSLAHFVEANPAFNDHQFEQFTKATLAETPEIFALSFNDFVTRAGLARYEGWMNRSSVSRQFRVTELDPKNKRVAVANRPDYVIVRYITPFEGNAQAIGFDINSEPVRRDAIERARVSRKIAVTAPIRLVQDDTVRTGVLVLDPVYRMNAARPSSPPELFGFAVAVIKVEDLVNLAVRGQIPQGVGFQIRDAQVADGTLRFYSLDATEKGARDHQWSTTLSIADRQWTLDLWTDDAYATQSRHWVAWGIGVIALLFTGLLQVYLHGMTGRVLAMRRQNQALLEKQAELQLAETVFDNTAEAIVVTDTAGTIISINPTFTHITGYALSEVQGKKMSVLSSGVHDPEFYQELWERLLAEKKWQGELINCRKNGELFTESITITAVTDSQGVVTQYVGTFLDITDKKAAQRQIEFMAYHDALTGLPNRSLGNQSANDAIERAQRYGYQVGILFMDLDHFKLVNDTYGHSVGDLLLQAVAQRLRFNVRSDDTLCRISGDEFMLILEHIHHVEDIAVSCEHLLAELDKPYDIDGRMIQTSLSVGISVYPGDGDTAEELLRKADTAMFEAKQGGRNTYCFFNPSMNQNVVEFVETRDALVQALKNDEFELYYQPQISLQDQRVVGVEALIRWHHPRKGLVGPAHIISVAEQSGLIVPIGAWALERACEQMKAWIDQGLPMQTMAVNLSAIQFKTGNLEKTITEALAKSELPPAHLELELTETILIEDKVNTLSTLKSLKDLGIRLSIDDFGTGYSSMAYLKRFQVDKIKIDSSFAAGVASDPEDTAIVRSIIQMAQALGLQSTAEGIEREDAIHELRGMGCTQIQGFYYAKPMPSAEFAAWVRHYRDKANLS